jgi:hypothetical protein
LVAGLVMLGTGCGSPDDAGSGGAEATVSTVTSSAVTSSGATSSAVTSSAVTSSAGVASVPGPCDVLSGAEVAAALGGSSAGGEQLRPQACVYPRAGGPPRLLVSVVPAGGSREALTAAPGFRRVDGLGEWAGWISATRTLTVLSHDRLLGLTYLGRDLDDAAARSALQGLARQALDGW